MSSARAPWSVTLAWTLVSAACGQAPATSDSDAGGGSTAAASGSTGPGGGATGSSGNGGSTGSSGSTGGTGNGGSTTGATDAGPTSGTAGASTGGAVDTDGSSGTTGAPAMCPDGLHDLDGDGTCEYMCSKTADDDATCDMIDEDCDGAIDDDVDLCASLEHCGACDNACSAPHGMTACVPAAPPPCSKATTSCKLVGCVCNGPQDCWWDNDGSAQTGCEYPCFKSNAGVEKCDALDNDCDGQTDEGGVCP